MIEIIPDADSHSRCIAQGLDPAKIPSHVAIIMDGNGRWAKHRLMERIFGHQEGAEALRRSLKFCIDYGIKTLSVYAFSTENWKRPKEEVSFLMGYLRKMLKQELPNFIENQVQVHCLGDEKALPQDLQAQIQDTQEKTKNNQKVRLNLLINYGGRTEILHAIQSIANTQPDSSKITEADITNHLYTKGQDEPDIIIRTGGEHRLSNFLLWQAAYSELFFSPVLWPDFKENELMSILKEFQGRNRRFGGISS